MNRIRQHIFLLLLPFCVLCCGESDDTVDDNDSMTGSLHGKVENTEGITYQVVLYQDGSLIAQTDSAGSYEFDEIAVGKYLLRISATGFKTVELDVEINAGSDEELETVTLKPLTETVDYPDGLQPGQGLSISSIAPDFKLSDGNGNLHALSDYLGQGESVVIVFYRFGG